MAKKDFECRICGSKNYEEIKEWDGLIGSDQPPQILYHECTGCTTHFSDPKKFSK